MIMNANYDRSMCVDEPAFRFCWLRENMPSHVDFDTGFLVARPDLLLAILGLHPGQQRLGRRVYITMRDVESGNLPEWAVRRMAAMIGPFRSNLVDWQAVARRIGEAAAPVPGIVELHLPYVDRRRWPHRIEVLERTEFALRGSLVAPAEMIDKAPRWNEYVARLIGALAVKGKGDVPLRCWFHKRVYGPLLDPLLPARLSNLPADRPVDVCVEFSLDPAACSAWLRSPAEVSGAYHPIHSQVSVAVQTALRRWMAFEWFDNEETFQDLLSAYTMLGYSAMTPYAKRIRTEFTYDTMDPEWMRGIFKHSRGQLREVLRAARRELLASGCKTLASWYYPANAKYIMDRVRRQRRNLHIAPIMPLVAIAMQFPVMDAALRYGEFVADLAAETHWPRELDVMGVGWVLFAD